MKKPKAQWLGSYIFFKWLNWVRIQVVSHLDCTILIVFPCSIIREREKLQSVLGMSPCVCFSFLCRNTFCFNFYSLRVSIVLYKRKIEWRRCLSVCFIQVWRDKEVYSYIANLKINDHLLLLLEFRTNLEGAVDNWKIHFVATCFTALSDHKNHWHMYAGMVGSRGLLKIVQAYAPSALIL